MDNPNNPQLATDPGPTGLRYYLDVLTRRAWLIAAVFAGVLLVVFAGLSSQRPEYRAGTTLIVGPDDHSATRINILARETQSLASRAPNLANHIELLRSRAMAERVLSCLPETTRARLTALGLNRPERVQTLLAVRPVRDADIIQLTVKAPGAELATILAAAYADAYREYSQTRSRADITAMRSFVELQLTAVAARLDTAEAALENYKRSHSITDVQQETRALIERQTQLLARHHQAAAERAGLQQKLDLLSRLATANSQLQTRNVAAIAENLKGEHRQVELQRAALLAAGYDTSGARLRRLLDRQSAIETRLATVEHPASHVALDPPALVDDSQVAGEIHALRAELARAGQVETVLSSQTAGYERELERLPSRERALARLTRDVEVNRQVHALLAQRREEARIQEAGRIASIGIVDPAGSAVRTRPNLRNNLLAALVLALALSAGTVLTVDRLDTRVQQPEDLERQGFSVLASVPQLATGSIPHELLALASHDPQSTAQDPRTLPSHSSLDSVVEAFRVLRTNIRFASAGAEARTLLVTSSEPGEGKTLIAANLAAVLAQTGKRTLLVDADLRRPRQHTLFRARKKPGLTDAALLGTPVEQAIRPGPVPLLSLLFAGTLPPSPVDFLNSEPFIRLLHRLRDDYDYVIVDSPPVLVSADAAVLSSETDGVLLVARMGRADRRGLAETYKILDRAGARLIGLVANDIKLHHARGYYRYRYRYYHSHYRPATIATAATNA